MCSLKYWQTSFKNHTREKTGILKAERLKDALMEVGMSCTVITNDIHRDDGNRDEKVGCGFCQMLIHHVLQSVIIFIVMIETSINKVLGVYCKSLCFHILLLVLIFTVRSGAQILTRAEKFLLLQNVKTGSGTHPVPIQCESGFYLGSKVAGV
jgi:hypothetical protein